MCYLLLLRLQCEIVGLYIVELLYKKGPLSYKGHTRPAPPTRYEWTEVDGVVKFTQLEREYCGQRIGIQEWASLGRTDGPFDAAGVHIQNCTYAQSRCGWGTLAKKSYRTAVLETTPTAITLSAAILGKNFSRSSDVYAKLFRPITRLSVSGSIPIHRIVAQSIVYWGKHQTRCIRNIPHPKPRRTHANESKTATKQPCI